MRTQRLTIADSLDDLICLAAQIGIVWQIIHLYQAKDILEPLQRLALGTHLFCFVFQSIVHHLFQLVSTAHCEDLADEVEPSFELRFIVEPAAKLVLLGISKYESPFEVRRQGVRADRLEAQILGYRVCGCNDGSCRRREWWRVQILDWRVYAFLGFIDRWSRVYFGRAALLPPPRGHLAGLDPL